MSVPGTCPKPSVVNQSGKSLMPRGPRTIRASPRKSASVPSVTTSDGRPPRPTRRPLSSAADDAHHEHERDRDLERDAGGPQEAEDRAGEAGHRLDREVDLAGDDDQRHRQRHDRDLHQGGQEVREVAGRQEERRERVAEQDQPDERDQQHRLPAGERSGSTTAGARRTPSMRGHRARRSAVRVRWIRRRMMVSTLTAARITTP